MYLLVIYEHTFLHMFPSAPGRVEAPAQRMARTQIEFKGLIHKRTDISLVWKSPGAASAQKLKLYKVSSLISTLQLIW